MSMIKNKVKGLNYVTVRVSQEEVREVLNTYLMREHGLMNVGYSFSKMSEESDDLVITFEDEELEDRFFNDDHDDYAGVESGDCGRILVAYAIACEFEISYSDVTAWVSTPDCAYIEVEMPLAVINSVNSQSSMVLMSCNEWKERASARIIGVYTNEESLKQCIANMFVNNELDWQGLNVEDLEQEVKSEHDEDISVEELSTFMDDAIDSVKQEIMESSVRDIHDKTTYIMIDDVRLNNLEN